MNDLHSRLGAHLVEILGKSRRHVVQPHDQLGNVCVHRGGMGMDVLQRGVFDVDGDIIACGHLLARGLDPAGDLGDLRLSFGHLGLTFLNLRVQIGHLSLALVINWLLPRHEFRRFPDARHPDSLRVVIENTLFNSIFDPKLPPNAQVYRTTLNPGPKG